MQPRSDTPGPTRFGRTRGPGGSRGGCCRLVENAESDEGTAEKEGNGDDGWGHRNRTPRHTPSCDRRSWGSGGRREPVCGVRCHRRGPSGTSRCGLVYGAAKAATRTNPIRTFGTALIILPLGVLTGGSCGRMIGGMTDEREALVAAIAAEPDEDTPRLVFADWLEENGEEDRAEFVRLECEIERGWPRHRRSNEEPSPRIRELVKRADALFEHQCRFWIADLYRALGADGELQAGAKPGWFSRLVRRGARGMFQAGYGLDPASGFLVVRGRSDWPVPLFHFDRGLVGSLHLNFGGSRPARDVTRAFRLEPVSRLRLNLVADANAVHWPAWNVPCLRRVRQLTLDVRNVRSEATAAVFESLAQGEHWTGLRELCFGELVVEPGSSEGYAEILSGSPILSGLESLQVSPNIPALRQFALSPRLANLRVFETWGFPAEAGAILAGATFREHLEQLWLLGGTLGDEGALALAQQPWPRLRALDLGGHGIGDAGVRHLLPLVPQLREFSLSNSAITDAGALTLAEALDPANLHCLCLSYNSLSPGTVQVLRDRFGDRFEFRTIAGA